MRKSPIAPGKSSISSLKQDEPLALPALPELPSTSSRRNLLVRPLEMAAVLGAFQMLNPAEAIADNSRGGQIDPSLVSDLQFVRKNSADPGAVFSSAGLLVGFGPNLLHCVSDTCRLFVNARPVLTSVSIEDVDDNIPELTVGTSGTLTQTIRDSHNRTITSTLVVTSINDIPDDFLITGKTSSNLYTGAFFEITMNVRDSNGITSKMKTTYDILTRSFPLGVNFSLGSNSVIDPDLATLLRIAAQTIHTNFGATLSGIPTDLQKDFPWKKVWHIVVAQAAFYGAAVATAAAIAMPGFGLIVLAVVAWGTYAEAQKTVVDESLSGELLPG